MYTQMPQLSKEYTLSFGDEEEIMEEEIKQISIEGYQVKFDKKVMVTPLEVVAENVSFNRYNKNK